jgi:SAM-dependent methyltransferase
MPPRAPDPRSVLARTLRHATRALYADPALYDALHHRRSRDLAFYAALADEHGGPVLELGVGSARIACAIARHGIAVVGVDRMAPMLARARTRVQRLPARRRGLVTLLRADVRRLDLGRRFPLVIAPFNALLHFYAPDDLLAVLEGCRRHLLPTGRLAFDVLTPDLRALTQPPDRLYAAGKVHVPEHGTHYRLREASHYDAAGQVRTTVLVLEPLAGPGTRQAIPLAQRQIFPAELPLLLDRAGFALERLYGDFDRSPFGEGSPSQIVLARPRRGRAR